MKLKKNFLYLVLGLVLVSIPLYCTTEKKEAKQATVQEAAGYFKDISELNKIVDTINLVENLFVGKETPSKEKMYESAIAGVINSLNDPYSEYLSKEELVSFDEDLNGNYVGVGMSIDKKKGAPLIVTSPFIGSPAAKAGIKIGDKIVKIDGKDILQLTATDTVKMLKGEKGTKVKVDVVREGVDNIMTFELTRDNIHLEFVESKMLENKIGYVSLLRFGDNTGDAIKKKIEDLQKQGMKALILDLRSNPGGSLLEAQDISSLFVKENLIVSLKYKDESKKDYNRTLKNLGDYPLVVLVNGGSASASEIVTGAIKDYKRGLIIGKKTFGKGVVQQVIPLKGGDAIKLTIAQYFTPKGNYIHEKGIEPDIVVDMEELLAIKGYANDSEEAKRNRMKDIEEIIKKEKGDVEAKKIIEAGDVQLDRALVEIKKMLNKK